VNDELLLFLESLNRFENTGKAPVRIPVLCYTSSDSEQPTADELSRCRVDACLPGDFEAVSFSQLVSSLASGLSGSAGNAPSLPVLKPEEFREQVGFDHELVVEIVDLFLADSAKQLESMQAAVESGDLLVLSRVAHSIKGSLGSLFAMQAASRAQAVEQLAKEGDKEGATAALAQLESALVVLKPELLRLRNAESGS
jgi:HPt (histidine-containing phosphotransfer) domain-containing protein